jgi:ketosteroid isomerase-like protein
VLGDWAYIHNCIEMTITPESGDTVTRSGYTLTVLRREAGEWRLARDGNLLR